MQVCGCDVFSQSYRKMLTKSIGLEEVLPIFNNFFNILPVFKENRLIVKSKTGWNLDRLDMKTFVLETD